MSTLLPFFVAPYFQYQCILDGRTRPEHKALHGKVFRYDDPFWQTMYPPNGWNCRCFVTSLSDRDLARKGLKVESSEGKLKEISTIVGGEEKTITAYDFRANGKNYRLKPDAGWNTNLGMFDYMPDLEKYDNKIASQIAETLTNSKVFDNYYDKCKSFAKKIEDRAIKDLTLKELPIKRGNIEKYAISEILNKKYSKSIKNLAFNIAVLTKEQQKLLKSKSKTIKLSVETLVKEQIKHSDLSIDDFKAIPNVIRTSDVLILKNNDARLIYYKYGKKYISLVLKTTKNKQENYILTYHYTNKKEILKCLEDKNIIIIFNKLDIKKE